nr:unnamed protein product [Callosobruchus chinensis]
MRIIFLWQDFDLIITLKSPPNSTVKGKCKESFQGETYRSFTNLPYAEPPIGKRRLQKPEPVQPWEGIYNATGVKKKCLQDPVLQVGRVVGTEDCLILNVYTPMTSEKPTNLLPVLFWIHGGAFQFGSGMHMIGIGSFDDYDPIFFMEEDIVVVTINYRLGALGFLTTQDEVIPANLGLRDQNLALKWVQENIELFGGDPRDIVMAGESVGSCSTCYHLLSNVPEMEAVTGAIMISGTCLSPFGFSSNSSARTNAFNVGRKLRLDLDESSNHSSAILLQLLQDIPVNSLFRAAGTRYSPLKSDDGHVTAKWSPVFADDFYPREAMADAIDAGRFHRVPLLFGFNSEECLSPVFLKSLPHIKQKAKRWDQDTSKMLDLTVNISDRSKAAEDIKSLYTNKSFSEDMAAVFCTDDEFTLPIGRHAESVSKYGIPVYMYTMDYRFVPHFVPGVEGVGHAEDMFFYWDTTTTKLGESLLPNFGLIVQRMVKLLTNFVTHKKPIFEPDGLFEHLEWPEFDSKTLKYMRIDTDLQVLSDIRNYSRKRADFDLTVTLRNPKNSRISRNLSTLLPVLFWIHGGAFQFGSGMHLLGFGSFAKYDPSFLMDEEIVVVTVNYRLGALGFLTTEDDVIPANLGLRDQNLALKWVQENIDLFGGDPRDIVITGESAGAASVCYHLLSNGPELKAVTGAIMISGTCLAPWALNKDVRTRAFDVGKKLGNGYSSDNNSATLLRQLQSLPVKTFFDATKGRYLPIKTNDGSSAMKWSPVFAKDFYPSEPMADAVDRGRFHKVPLLFGFNSEESLSPLFLMFLPEAIEKAKLWDQDSTNMIATILNIHDRLQASKDMKALYTNKRFQDDIAALVEYCTDDQMTLPIGKHAESASKNGVPVYMYMMAFRFFPHFTPGIEGVGHAEDLFLVWDTLFTKVLKLLVEDYRLVSTRLEDLFQNLVWPKFESKHLQYMRVDAHMAVHSDPRNYSAKRFVWDKHLQKPISVY